MNNKKGLSDVVATVLIILLALAAVAIVWRFVSPTIGRTGTASNLQSKCFTIDVEPVNCVQDTTIPVPNPSGGTNTVFTVSYRLKKGDSKSINTVKAIVETSDENKYTADGLIGELLQTSSKDVIVTLGAGVTARHARIAVVVQDDKGNTATCNPSTKIVTCSLAASTGICPNGIVEPGEACDDDNTIDEVAAECAYGLQSCMSGCSTTCQNINGIPNYCGDGDTGDTGESSENCDNGNANSVDGTCNINCQFTFCSDGTLQTPNGAGFNEECDDSGNSPDDGCSPSCTWDCGDGVVTGTEECDPTSTLPKCVNGDGYDGIGPVVGTVTSCPAAGSPTACICV